MIQSTLTIWYYNNLENNNSSENRDNSGKHVVLYDHSLYELFREKEALRLAPMQIQTSPL